MEAMILDIIGGVLLRVDHHMLGGSVQHVGHPNVLQVGDVADCLSVANYDPVKNLYSNVGLGSSLRGEPGLTTFRIQGCP